MTINFHFQISHNFKKIIKLHYLLDVHINYLNHLNYIILMTFLCTLL
jgi:hypothetical protein